jgi:hypothetical protein
MKKMFLAAVVLFLSATQGFCQESSLQLIIKSDNEIYSQGEQIKLSLTFRNTSKKRISICFFDIEHKLSEGLRFKSEGKIPPTYRLKDWTKRKLPIVTGKDFIFLEPQEEYDIELIIDTVIPSRFWRYIYDENEHTWKWGEGLNKLLIGKYQIVAKYENSIVGIGDHGELMQKGWRNTTVIIEAHNAWTGTLTSNTINIKVVEKKISANEKKLLEATSQFNQKIDALIKKYKNSNPEEDARIAFNNNDRRFMAMEAFGVVPGVEDWGIEKNFIPETGDVILSKKHDQFQKIAGDYAERYNREMLRLIRANKNKP